MPTYLRWLLWAAIIVAPGGVLLLPLLAVDGLRARAKPTADAGL